MRNSRATHLRVRRLLVSVSVAALLAAQTDAVSAHTVSIGYAFAGPGSVNIWYGSYHSDATFNEADLRLVGPGLNSIVPFLLISPVKPAGLVDGVTNFYSNSAGTALVGTPQFVTSTDGSGGSFNPATGQIYNWQGVTFTNLRPGQYTFTYNPLSVPTVEWHPINEVIRTNSFTLTAQDVLGIDSFASYGTNTNQRATATALDTGIAAGGYNQRIYNIAALSPGRMANAFTQLSGEAHTQSSRAAFLPSGVFLSSMMDPFAGGLRDGGFGAAPFGQPQFGQAQFGSAPYGQSQYGGSSYGASPNGAAYYDPQNPGGFGGGDATQRYGDPAYGNPYNPNAPYDGSGQYAPNGPYASSGSYGPNGAGSPYNNGANGNSPYGGGQAYGSLQYDRGRGQFVYAPVENRWSVWQTTYGSYSAAQGDTQTGSHDTILRSGGVIAGLDFRFETGGVLGVAIAGGTTNWALSGALGGGKSDSMQIGAYGSQRFGAAYVSGAFAAGWHKMTTDRTVAVGGADQLRGSFDARTTGGRAETGYRIAIDDYGLTPHIAAQTLSSSAPGYGETVTSGQNDFALNIDQRKTTQTRSEAGVWLDRSLQYSDARVLLRGRVAWVHEWMDAPAVSASFQALPGSGFSVIGAGQAPDRALVSVGAEARWPNGLSVGAKFDGEFSRGVQNYIGTTTVRYQW